MFKSNTVERDLHNHNIKEMLVTYPRKNRGDMSKFGLYHDSNTDRSKPRPTPKYRQANGQEDGSKRTLRYWPITIAIVIVLFVVGWAVGSSTGDSEVEAAIEQAKDAKQIAEAAQNNATHWMQESQAASETIGILQSKIASATVLLDAYEQQAIEASATIKVLQDRVDDLEQKIDAIVVKPQSYTKTVPNTSGVEQWRPLVAKYFKSQYVDAALSVMRQESGGNPNAKNRTSGASGLFQQMPQYWSSRLASTEKALGINLNDSIFDPEANVAVSSILSNGGANWSHWSAKP